MNTKAKLKKQQIVMVVLTIVALIIGIMPFVNSGCFFAMRPLLTVELLLALSFIILVACPVSILVDKLANKHFDHFKLLHGTLFGLSIVEWGSIITFIILAINHNRVVWSLSDATIIVGFHAWVYITLLTYLVMVLICIATRKDFYYINEYESISHVWGVCFRVWKGIGVAAVTVAFLGFVLIWDLIIRPMFYQAARIG